MVVSLSYEQSEAPSEQKRIDIVEFMGKFDPPPTLTCQQVRPELGAYNRSELSTEMLGRIKGHLLSCDDCADVFTRSIGHQFPKKVGATEPPSFPEGTLTPFSQLRKEKLQEMLWSKNPILSWPQRIQSAFAALTSQGRQSPERIASRLHNLSKSIERKAEAAFEVVINEVDEVGKIFTDSVSDLVAPHLGFSPSTVSAMQRGSSGTGEHRSICEKDFLTNRIDAAHVQVDFRNQSLTITFEEGSPGVLVMLIPKDPNVLPMYQLVEKSPELCEAIFQGLPSNAFVVTMYPLDDDLTTI